MSFTAQTQAVVWDISQFCFIFHDPDIVGAQAMDLVKCLGWIHITHFC